MKVIDPTDTTHELKIVPRYYPIGALVVTLKNEITKTEYTPANTYRILDGFLYSAFTYTFTNKDRYQIKITEGTEVVYRGKIFVTTQTPQDYKITDGIYYYE